MRLQFPILFAMAGAVAVGACSTTPVQETRSPAAAKELAEALEGRIAGQPARCIPNYRANQMQIVDDMTILFRDGRTTYVQSPRGGCRGIANGSYTLVMRVFGTNQLCDGDINRLVDLRTGMQGGACVFGPFQPYTKPKV